MTGHPTRRRFIGISAAAAGLAVLPLRAARGAGEAGGGLTVWHGQALGAVCALQVHHPDEAEAGRLVHRVVAEVRRLERMFSLYDEASLLVQLNRTGVVVAPPPEFVDLLTRARAFSELTSGAFDVTVQPLWRLYLDHFATPGADPEGPPPERVRAALARVGPDRLVVGADRVSLQRGSAVTLNGIAQGYVTDRIVELLRAEGVDHSLVDMGETRVLGNHPDGRPWQAAVADPQARDRAAAVLPLVDRALATSGPYGFRFDAQGRFNHLVSPSTGGCARQWASVSVVARTATAADALSTALCLLPEPRIRTLATTSGIDLVLLVDEQGRATRIAG
jgi:FAD:protein FMN transferase